MNSRKSTLFVCCSIAILFLGTKTFCVNVGAGILLYRNDLGETSFLVGFNEKTKAETSDFGTEYDSKKDDDILSTAARGFNEKTMFMFADERWFPLAEKDKISWDNINNIYKQEELTKLYHARIKEIIKRPMTHRLYKKGAGFEYTLFLIPLKAMPINFDDQKSDDHTKTKAITDILTDLATSLIKSTARFSIRSLADVSKNQSSLSSGFAWISAENLDTTFKNEEMTVIENSDKKKCDKKHSDKKHRVPFEVLAPTYKDLTRGIALSPEFAMTLRSGRADNGNIGWKSILPELK